PFDGSMYYSTLEEGKLHYLRATCYNDTLQGPPLGIMMPMTNSGAQEIKRQSCPPVNVPVVGPPTILRYVIGGGHGRPKVLLARPTNPLDDPGNNPDGARLAAAQIVFYEFIN